MRKMGVQSLWIDKVSLSDNEIKVEVQNIKRALNKSVDIQAYCVYFVREKVTQGNIHDLSKLTYLSYSMIVNYSYRDRTNSYLLFSFVSTPMKYNLYKNKAVPLTNHYYHSTKDYTLAIKGRDGKLYQFKINCSPFFQQNGLTTFCIQSALATLFNHLNISKKIILPMDINKIARLKFKQCLAGGLDIKQTKRTIKNKRLFYKTFDFHADQVEKLFKNLKTKYDLPPSGIIYPWMESGFPGFIVFETQKGYHAMPIIGHTLSTDLWRPEADIRYKRYVRNHFRSVSAWVDNYIINDDNFGMYLTYPTSKLEDKKRNLGYLVQYILFMTPKTIDFTPDTLEIDLIKILRNYLKRIKKDFKQIQINSNPWLEKLVREEHAPLVSRTLFVEKNDYIKTLQKKDSNKKILPEEVIRFFREKMPDNFWLTEITFPDLYVANKSALIHIASSFINGEPLYIQIPKFSTFYRDFKPRIAFDHEVGGHRAIYSIPSSNETFDW
ncbi:MAG: hypothetical protein HZA07_07755 [Nitrospirae bacterium]|nr:hypothetical protein [Nitrospirota bacterium]